MTKNNISSLSHQDCCGCKLCADICPKGSISFMTDSEGFYMPQVDENTCINCGLCSKKCPELNVSLNKEAPCAVSAISVNQERKFSASSGGIFGTLAAICITDGGRVYGAAFDKDNHLKHIGVDAIEDLKPLYKSKYLQSDCSGIYKSIQEDLKAGKKVLFCGTPCQCQAIYNSVNKSYRDNLLIVDFACHGVSCQELFDENIHSYKEQYGKVLAYQFRNKTKAKYHHSYKITFEKPDGRINQRVGTYFEDPYYYGYEKRFILRNSCYSCKWARIERCSDITLSDFFGFREIESKIKEKYVSCLFCNTQRGQESFESVKDELSCVKKYPIETATVKNECFNNPIKP